MNEETRVSVDREYYVNEATLDYLRRRIEGEVKGNFFRWIGLPVGGAGIIVIILTIFFWVPEKIEAIIETNPVIQETLDQSAMAYLNDPDRGQVFISQQLQTDIERYLKDPQKGQKLIQQEIENTARTQIERITTGYFESAGEPLIRDLADAYLKSAAVRDVLVNAINTALKPHIDSLSGEIRQNVDRLVIETAMPARDTRRIDKSTMTALFDFLRSEEADNLKREKRPVALALTVRQGSRYNRHAVIEYIHILSNDFGQAFSSVLVFDSDGTFIARLAPSFVLSAVDPLMELFNSGPQVPASRIRKSLEQMHDPYCTASVRSRWKVIEALTSRAWQKNAGIEAEVPVIDENRHFIGLTSRQRLIHGVLG